MSRKTQTTRKNRNAPLKCWNFSFFFFCNSIVRRKKNRLRPIVFNISFDVFGTRICWIPSHIFRHAAILIRYMFLSFVFCCICKNFTPKVINLSMIFILDLLLKCLSFSWKLDLLLLFLLFAFFDTSCCRCFVYKIHL